MGVIQKNIVLHFLLAASILRIPYPEVRRDLTVVDDYHGTKIADPYRWLEDIDSKETTEFVQKQVELTQSFLKEIPSRDGIRKRLTNVWNYPQSSSPEKVGKKYYKFENTGLQNQSIMYVQDSLDAPARVFLDPNKFSADATIALDSYAFTENGELFAYATTQSGSDWKVVRIMNVTTGENLPDVLENSKWPGLEWSHDNKGLFYARYPSQDSERGVGVTENSKIYYHFLGTPQADDILIAEFPEFPKRSLYATVTDCGGYLIIGGQEVFNANSVHIASLKDGINKDLKSKIVPVFPSGTDAAYTYVDNVGSTFLFETSKDAPNHKLITVNVDTDVRNTTTSTSNGTEVGQYSLLSTFLSEHPKNVISWVSVVDTDKLLVCYLEDVKNTLELRSLKTAALIQKVELPAGTISSFTSETNADKEFFFILQNLLSPGTGYRCLIDGLVECKVINQISVADIDLKAYISEQVFYPSKDGTLIPMYILRKKNVPLDGTAPVLLYGYGGFNSVLLPRYSSSNLVFVEDFDGIYVQANIRGGGEYGEKWHEAGSLLNKQNVFDDFHAAAEYLIKNKYTSASKLTIKGGSNGGLLVAACVNQRPELYGAAIAQVGVMDMLRFQKFTIGYAWCPEYGCSENKSDFQNLIKYSPLHNIRFPTTEGAQYPAVLVTTADHDDRVVPAHSYKYIAELQHTIGQDPRQTNPLLLRVDVKAGHGAGKPTSKRIEEVVDTYAFLAETLDLKFTESTMKTSPSN